MQEKRTIRCPLDQRWLFDTTARTGCIEIKCMKCKNVLRINLDTNSVEYPNLRMVNAMSI